MVSAANRRGRNVVLGDLNDYEPPQPVAATTCFRAIYYADDRAAFFETYFDGRQTQYLYLLKVVNPGLFKVGPARVSPMYQPQYFATSEAREVTIR